MSKQRRGEPNASPAEEANTAVTHSKAINPFLIFLHEYRQKLKQTATELPPVAKVAIKAGEVWRQMAGDEKLSYKAWARKNQEKNRIAEGRINKTHRDTPEGPELNRQRTKLRPRRSR